jgi:predicted SnoaL-like aldol condensation-catalyzing enzyme
MTTTTQRNKALVADLYAKVWNGRDIAALGDFVAEDYIQHNPSVGNGRATLQAFLGPILERLPEARFTVVRLIAEGDLVVAHTLFQTSPGDRGMVVVDIYRVEDGRLAEHWDVKEAVPETTASGNPMV